MKDVNGHWMTRIILCNDCASESKKSDILPNKLAQTFRIRWELII